MFDTNDKYKCHLVANSIGSGCFDLIHCTYISGSAEIGAFNLCLLICFRHLIGFFNPKRPIFLHAFAQHVN